MRPHTLLAAICLLLSACASQWGLHPDDENVVSTARTGSLLKPVRMQQMTLEVDGVIARRIRPSELQVGDILLSGMTTIRSTAIKLATFSQVSHAAVHVGDGHVVEAVRSGVRLYSVEQALLDGETIVAYRRPDITSEHQEKLRSFALEQVGLPYNHLGIVMHGPLSFERKFCEVPGIPGDIRDNCVRTVGRVQMAPTKLDPQQSYFCSELVLDAYKAAGLSLVDAPSELIVPADILHMREGDVSTFIIPRKLVYVGRVESANKLAAE